jgi:protein-disulfide isomerase
MHAQARPAAQYFEAIALQSSKKAFAFHDKVFLGQDKLTADREAFLEATAKAVGADVARLKKDIGSEKVLARIASDEKLAQEIGFTGTPGFVVGGVVLKGAYPAETFEKIIEHRLSKKKRDVSSTKN